MAKGDKRVFKIGSGTRTEQPVKAIPKVERVDIEKADGGGFIIHGRSDDFEDKTTRIAASKAERDRIVRSMLD